MFAAATSEADRSARKAPTAIERAEAVAPARPAVSTKLDPPVAPETPATIPKTAPRPSLAPYTAPEIQLDPLWCHCSRPSMRLVSPPGLSTPATAHELISSASNDCAR